MVTEPTWTPTCVVCARRDRHTEIDTGHVLEGN